MKYVFVFVTFVLLIIGCKDDQITIDEPINNNGDKNIVAPEVDKTYRPFLHLFTSIHCGGCGRFGIPVSEITADEMGDSIFMLPTHFKYNDVFITNSSLAIEKALVVTYHSPQLWVHDKEYTYDIINFSHRQASDFLKEKLRDKMGGAPGAYIGLDYKLKENGRFDVTVAIENASSSDQELYYEVYAMEDSLNEVQAGNNPYRRDHHRVNRGGHYGEMGQKHVFSGNEKVSDNFEFVPCLGCTSSKMYFAVVVWRSLGNGRFEYVNGKYFR